MRKELKIVTPFILLALVLAVSGCVGQKPVTVAPNDGLVITNFDADQTTVDEGESVSFTLDIENQGGTDATSIIAELSGIEGQWRNLDGTLVVDTMPKEKNLLKPPEPESNLPGDFKTFTWRLKTPEVPQLTYTLPPVIAKVIYNYKTTGSIQIHALSKTFYKTEFLAKNKPLTSTMTVQNTNAPVKIELTDKTNAIIVDDASDADEIQTFPVRFLLKNVGSGFPITEGVPGRFLGTIKLAGPFKFADCLGFRDTSEVEIIPDNVDEFAKLKTRTGEALISCDLSVPKSLWGERQEETIDMKFDLIYRYYIDRSVSIQIIGK
jgi:hypothetical protein